MGEVTTGTVILLAFLAVVAIVGARLAMLRLQGESLSTVEFEWNPLSIASRAARAEQDGRVGEALRLYAKAGQGPRVLARMKAALPNWPVRDTLLTAAQELLDLELRAINARTGIPETVKDRLAAYVENAASVMWTTADRLATAATLTTSPPKGLQRESAKLERLLQAIRDARVSLADLTLSGGTAELDGVERDFQKLSDVAQSLATEE